MADCGGGASEVFQFFNDVFVGWEPLDGVEFVLAEPPGGFVFVEVHLVVL